MLKGLKQYIEDNIGYDKDHQFYNESFCNLTFDYLGMTGYEITTQDKEYLEENGYTVENFDDDEDYPMIVRED